MFIAREQVWIIPGFQVRVHIYRDDHAPNRYYRNSLFSSASVNTTHPRAKAYTSSGVRRSTVTFSNRAAPVANPILLNDQLISEQRDWALLDG